MKKKLSQKKQGVLLKKKRNITGKVQIKEKIIITAALPYANGSIHIGHLLEYIQADIYARFLKMQGKDALYICASDMHGTPIEVNAAKIGMKPELFVQQYWQEHQQDFASFLISFDEYYKTHSSENKKLAEFFFSVLKKKKFIYHKKTSCIYCSNCKRYLPDRFVKGECPQCHTPDQYGDVCEKCSSVLKGANLVNPYCVICKNTPLQKDSVHYFFKLSAFQKKLEKWMQSVKSNIQPEVNNWLQGWLDNGLEDWCISRDAPYFGFEIPEATKETGEKKYFYVWLDAPIGYISSTKHYCDNHRGTWENYWKKGKVYHFIGKDIAYFHYLFWPAMLMGMGIPVPKLNVHGFITVNGQKMSKSRGTFFTARDFLSQFPVEALRFYYASHLDRSVADIDLNFEDFKAVNNNVLMGSLGNFCYRVLTFAQRNYGEVKNIASERQLIAEINGLMKATIKHYQEIDFKRAVHCILKIADAGNAYFQKSEVWKKKDTPEAEKVVGLCVNIARNLGILVLPILPLFSGKLNIVFGENLDSVDKINFKWKGKLNSVPLLVQKIEHVPSSNQFPLKLQIGEIKEVKNHPNADNLYLLKVDFGKTLGLKQVVAGLKKNLTQQQLLGQTAVFCVNMKPVKLRGELSEAMILVAEDDDKKHLSLLQEKESIAGDDVQFEEMVPNDLEVTYDDFKKLVLTIKEGKIIYEMKTLKCNDKEVIVKGVTDGTRIS